ncbi:MAG: hypothetical protein KJ077_50225 [Anaerolineae bacterium]|nr:hypothetical protein [Anaerolineae bacterium]
MSTTTTVQLSVTNTRTGQVTLNETFHIAADLTGVLIEQLEAIVATLPPKRVRMSRQQEKGTTIIDLEVLPEGGASPRTRNTPQPTFADRYRRKGKVRDGHA